VRSGVVAVATNAWAGRTPGGRLLGLALRPPALAYGMAVALRNRLYDAGWLRIDRVPAEVLSVGNIDVGGTGKTPATLWLAEALAARGRRVGIVSRGYGKRRPGVVIVGEAGRPLVGPAEGGDEPVLLAGRFAGPVVAGERRVDAARDACRRFGLDTIVLDDGFQHRALARSADLVLVHAETAGARLLPAGPLREPIASLVRARALLAVDTAVPDAIGACVCRRVFRGRLRPTALLQRAGPTWAEAPLGTMAAARVVAVAGVARPERFLRTLAEIGARVDRVLRFPDHHRYTGADVARILRAAGEGTVVTTEKDLVKLAEHPELGAAIGVRVTLEVEDGEALVDLLTAGPG
jgi:tetraacyldisaccharide 4'-kinase